MALEALPTITEDSMGQPKTDNIPEGVVPDARYFTTAPQLEVMKEALRDLSIDMGKDTSPAVGSVKYRLNLLDGGGGGEIEAEDVSFTPYPAGSIDAENVQDAIEELAFDVYADLATRATTSYVDALVQGLSPKKSVRVATTAAVTLATAFENGDTIDGVVLATGDRILVKDQAAGAENGIYTVNASGAPTRATDMDLAAEVQAGVYCYVEEGTANAGSGWALTTDGTITLNTTSLAFEKITNFALASATPAAVGTAAVGTASKAAREDHVHAIVDASDTVKGAVELATSAECITGTDTVRAVTPAGLKAYVDQVPSAAEAAGFTVTAAHIGGIVFMAASGTAALNDLSASLTSGKAMIVTIEPEGDAVVVTVDPGAGVTINGSTSNFVATAGARVSLTSRNGLAWRTGAAL